MEDLIELRSNSGQPYSESEIIHILRSLCKTLMKMKNNARLVHRDLKPANLIIDEFGKKYLLTDFGTACQVVQQQNGKD